MKPIKILLKSDCSRIQRDAPTERILEIAVKAPAVTSQKERLPFNLALVIDRSGSMSGQKLEQVKSAVGRILELLNANDLISLVTFDDQVRTLCNGIQATEANKRELHVTLQALQAGGSTALCDGYLEGCRCVANQPMENRINRVLLLTDGEANVGPTDPLLISQYSSDLFDRGIVTSTFGVGLGFNEMLLQMMADRGGGNTYFIQDDHQIQGFLLQEFSAISALSARKVELTLTFPAACTLEVFGEWKHRFHTGILHIALSDLVADSVTRVMIKVLTPPGDGELEFNVQLEAISSEGDSLQAAARQVRHYVSHQEVAQAPRDEELLGTFASILFGHVTRDAIRFERERKYKEAEKILKTSLDQYGKYAPESVRQQVESLSHQVLYGLDESVRKNSNQVSFTMRKSRHPDQIPEKDQWD